MASRLAVESLNNAVARRQQAGGNFAGCVLHTDRGSRFRSRKLVHAINRHHKVRSMGRVGAARDSAAMESWFALLQKNVLAAALGPPERTFDRRRRAVRPGKVAPGRIRVDRDHSRYPGGLTPTVTCSCSSPTRRLLNTAFDRCQTPR